MANKANSFLSGFTGGMGAMGQMINARDQRDYNAQKMEWMKEDRAFQNQEKERLGQIRQSQSMLHYYNNATKEQRSAMEQTAYDSINSDKKWQSYMNNSVPGETVKLNRFDMIRDKDGKLQGMSPMLDIMDDKGKLLRSGYLTQDREKGGQQMIMPTQDFIGLIGSNDMKGARLAAEMKLIELGGELSKSEKYGDIVTQNGMLGQFNLNNNKFTPFTSKKGGSGSSTSGSSDSWKKIRSYEFTDKTNPDRVINRLVERMGDTNIYRYADDDGTGNFQHNYFEAKSPDSLGSLFGNPDPGGTKKPDADTTTEKETIKSKSKNVGDDSNYPVSQTLKDAKAEVRSKVLTGFLNKPKLSKEEELYRSEEEERLNQLLGMSQKIEDEKRKRLAESATHWSGGMQ